MVPVSIRALSRSLFEKQPACFFLVSLVGVVADLGLGTILLFFVTTSTYTASLAGVSTGLIIAYIGHQKFTFGSNFSQLEWTRFMTFICSSCIVIGVRFSVIFIVNASIIINDSLANAFLLVFATSISFVMNYFFSKFIVFKAIR